MRACVCLSLILLSARARAAGAESAAVVVRSDTDCPSASAVREALAGLLTPAWATEAPDIVELRHHDGALEVRLTAATGPLIAERRLTTAQPCGARAQTVAVVVAAWETRLRAGQPAVLPRIAEASSPAKPAPRPTPTVPAATSEESATVVTTDAAPPPPLELETRAGLLMSIADGTIAPAVTCDVSLSHHGARFAGAVGAIVVGTHGTPVVPGRADWRRLGGVVDLRSTLRWTAFDLEMHAGAALTALTITGKSLPVTAGATLVDPGVLVGIRSRFRVGRVSPWIEATAAFWPLAHTLYVDGIASAHELPSFEALLGLGLSFGGP